MSVDRWADAMAVSLVDWTASRSAGWTAENWADHLGHHLAAWMVVPKVPRMVASWGGKWADETGPTTAAWKVCLLAVKWACGWVGCWEDAKAERRVEKTVVTTD